MLIKKISGLQNFYFNTMIRSKLFLIVYCLLLILPAAIVVVTFYLAKMSLYESSYIYIMVLLLAFFINLIIISIKLFANQISDWTDVSLISKSISRHRIFMNKALVCFVLLIINFLIQSIMAIIISSIFYINSLEILAYWLITFFGQIIVALIIVPIIFYLSFNFSKVIALSSSLLLLTVFLLTSFLAHFIFPDSGMNNQLINDDQYKMSYSKLISIDKNGDQVNQELVIKQNISNSMINDNSNYKTNLNNVSIANNFMPGEWLTSPFQTMYMVVNYADNFKMVADVAVDKYKYGIVRFNNESIVSTKNLDANLFHIPIMVQDQSIFNLNPYDLTHLLTENIKSVINSQKDTIDFSNSLQVKNILDKIKNNDLNWDQNFSKIEINTISALVGLNGESNLYYAFKYKNLLQAKLNGWFNEISSQISKPISEIYQSLFNNYHAYLAILYNNGHSNNFSDDQYPTINVYNDSIVPMIQDLDYFKNILVTWQTSTPSLLLNDNSRKIIDLSNFVFDGKTYVITNKIEWVKFIDDHATSLINLKNIYSALSSIATASSLQIKSVNYAPNYLDLNQYSYVAEIGQQTWIDNAYIYMIFIILISIVANIYVYKKYCKKDF